MNQIERPPHPRQCTATSKRSGQRCGKCAMKAQAVCSFHGGKAKRALANAQRAVERAELRLRGLTVPAVDAIDPRAFAEGERRGGYPRCGERHAGSRAAQGSRAGRGRDGDHRQTAVVATPNYRFLATVMAAVMTVTCGGNSSPIAPLGTVEVLYESGTPIAGFQFRVTGAGVTGAGGGTAAVAGFTVNAGNNIVLGFSFAGVTIPAGNGVLVVLEVTGSGDVCLTDLVISDSSGDALGASVEDCLTIVVP